MNIPRRCLRACLKVAEQESVSSIQEQINKEIENEINEIFTLNSNKEIQVYKRDLSLWKSILNLCHMRIGFR